MTEIQVDRNDLRKLSSDFRAVASRLLRTDFNDADSNLRRFIRFIDENEIISGFIEQKREISGSHDIALELEQSDFDYRWNIPDDPDQEIAYVYSLLKDTARGEHDLNYFKISFHYDRSTNKIQSRVNAFNRSVVQPFVDHINRFLERLMYDAGLHDGKATLQITNTGTLITNPQGSNIAFDGGTVSESKATYTDAAGLAQSIGELRSFLDNVPADQRDEAEEAIDVLIASASGEKVPKSQLAQKVEFLGGISDKMQMRLTEIAVGAGGGVASHLLIQAINYVFGIAPT